MPTTAPALLRLVGITKAFGALRANDDITLELHAGEVLALLGENGAGKSTLVSVLFGHYVADAGTIEVEGRPLPPGDTRAALAAGIGMVHQHFTLADNLSVLDNVMLGTEPLWRPWSRRAAARARLLDTARRFGLTVQPDARVGTLAVGERQQVEILKALVRGARILILDEPTAVLTPQQSASLFATLRQLVAEGLAIVFITHKLDEVLAVAQRVAVLRAGRLVADLPAADANKPQLAELMVGHAVAAPRRDTPAQIGAPVCVLDGVGVRGPKALADIHLQLRAGEIVGIAGVSGNGQQTLVDLLCGLCRADAGRLTLNGTPLPPRPRAWIDAGVARVPEDRHAVGVIGDLALWENTLLERYATPRFSNRFGVLRRERARAHARALLERNDVRGAAPDAPARRLSGGNMQKLILGRALDPSAGAPMLIVAHQPTWGLDVGAVAAVHRRLIAAAQAGAAVLLVSEDLDELFAIADRLAVMHQGRLTTARLTAEWTLAQVGLAMSGQRVAEPVMGGRV
jgi:ABC-type uncharacterized transport system ATPase subunit